MIVLPVTGLYMPRPRRGVMLMPAIPPCRITNYGMICTPVVHPIGLGTAMSLWKQSRAVLFGQQHSRAARGTCERSGLVWMDYSFACRYRNRGQG